MLEIMYLLIRYYVTYQLNSDEDFLWIKDECYPKLLSIFNAGCGYQEAIIILIILSKTYEVKELYETHRKLTQFLTERFFDPKEEEFIAVICLKIVWSGINYEESEKLKDKIVNLTKHKNEVLKKRALKALKEIMEKTIKDMYFVRAYLNREKT